MGWNLNDSTTSLLRKISFLSWAKWLHSTKMWRTVRLHWQCSHRGGGSIFRMSYWYSPQKYRRNPQSLLNRLFLQTKEHHPVKQDMLNTQDMQQSLLHIHWAIFRPASAPQLVCLSYILLLIRKSSPWSGGSRFPLTLSVWNLTICLMPHNCKYKCVECIVK